LVCALCFSPGFWLTRVLAWSPLVLIGSVSYEIYLSHITVFRVLSRLGLERWPAAYYPLTFVGAITVGWAFHRIFSKPAQRIVRTWFDRRPA
jgi:peptidoglycan/LPS O-acetylase OafA/YrhL